MTGEQKGSEDEKIYKILSHKIRRKIIQLIGDSGTSTYTEISKEVNLEPGTLYHHIDYLKEYVEQDQEKRYRLTSLGKAAYRLIHDGDFVIKSSFKTKSKSSKLFDVVSLSPMYKYVAENPLRFLPEALIVIGLLSYLTIQSGLANFGLFYSDMISLEPLLKIVIVLITWLGLTLFTEAFSRIALHTSKNLRLLIINTALSMTPFIIFLIIVTILNQFITFPDPLHNPVTMSGLILTQIWFLSTFTRGIQYAKKVARSYAAMIGLICYYINVIALILIVF
ncbi:MAG: winged helix-turn-helix domain-containing protein [Candidatus Odinarchaeota archaeon]